jgi:hypothetical protein
MIALRLICLASFVAWATISATSSLVSCGAACAGAQGSNAATVAASAAIRVLERERNFCTAAELHKVSTRGNPEEKLFAPKRLTLPDACDFL